MPSIARCCGVLAAAFLAVAAQAQTYPAKPVRMIIASTPGAPSDVLARPVMQKLGGMMGQPFVIDYKPGGNSVIGVDYVAKSPADGHTMLIFGSSFTINPSTQKALPFDALKNFTAVSPLGRSDIVLVVHPGVAARSVRELIDLAKAQPGRLNFASTGNGGSPHLAGEMFKIMTGADITHVPYKGAGPAIQDVVAGVVNMSFVGAAGAVPLIKADKLRVLGVASLVRAPYLSDVPTVHEQGLSGFEVISYYGISTPAGTPRPIINSLNDAIQKVMAMSDVRQVLTSGGVDPWALRPEEFQAWLAQDIERWARVTKAIGFVPE